MLRTHRIPITSQEPFFSVYYKLGVQNRQLIR